MSVRWRILVAVLAAALMIGGLAGCAQFDSLFKSDEAQGGPTGQYYNFEDIEVPVDLKIDDKRSFVYETGGFKAGTLLFSGYVEIDSLAKYFSTAMVKDGWKLKSTFRYPKQVLLFEKEKKVAIIIIYEGTINTHVEIWVAPSV
ncbi:MAG: hypothetical protein KKB20_15285 [Proteobacteria bacterium]|nr:hypothetical protein [Pseudomonadota bacterium]